jgi:hypothetical protein
VTPLSTDLRRQLESVVVQAREDAEAAARSALTKLAVDAAEPFDHFDAKQRDRRNRLRARGRQVGDVRHGNATQSIDLLSQELAYEYWHRMLFARFLAENHLLMHPDGGVAVSLEECKELAPDEGAADEYVLAARYASRMLPQIFRTDDVLLEIEFAPEQRLALERLLAGLPRETFLADDSLGWVYQFWQTKRKDEVNKTGDKIDGTTLPAVTQLFTENYMVRFLLHNTIGAWWCGRHGITGPAGGAGVPAGQAPVEMEYLRWKDDGTPAAGTFPGWPKTLAEFTALDPCAGSGHFLVSLFQLLVPLRMADEGLSAAAACDAVLRQNLFGLELDPRCVQIAAFALALAAWKYPDAGGYRELPPLNIACSGQGVSGKREQWLALANGDAELREQIELLYEMFLHAPDLGSLIDPVLIGGPLFQGIYADLHPRLARRLAKFIGDAEQSAVGVAAQGIAKAAELLSGRYTLVATNVPYLGWKKQADVVKEYLDDPQFRDGQADLATAFVLRCLQLCKSGGTAGLVTPQHWLYLIGYKSLRENLLKSQTWNIVARLGPRAFETISGEVVNVALLVVTATKPHDAAIMSGVEVAEAKTAVEKANRLAGREPTPLLAVRQADQLRNPDAIIRFAPPTDLPLLEEFATNHQGLSTGDNPRFRRLHWEVPAFGDTWEPEQSSPEDTSHFGGRSGIIKWQGGKGELWAFGRENVRSLHNVDRRGEEAWGKHGVAIGQMNNLPATLYQGKLFDTSVAVILPKNKTHWLPIWMFIQSPSYREVLRSFNKKVSVDNGYLTKVPFDLAYWQTAAAEKYPHGLPEPHSYDPTQWLFKGDIATSTDPLQVAVARLLGYRWPEQPAGPDAVDKIADDDGIVCLPGVREEAPAAERLRDVLIAGYGEKWSEAVLTKLLTDAGCKAGATLHDWLAGSFFDQHCKRFGQRPFIWHVWDGRKDGFSALVNYHKLNHKTLENLTYSYLGDWITAQTAEARAGKVGADLRLAAAQQLQENLKLILAGEPPYDIFVRWKPLSEQPIGWNPDLNDGVRMNIRPFVEAGVLRKAPNVKWTKDRGNEPQRDKAEFPWFWAGDKPNTERVNDVHLTTAEKQAARDKLKPKGAKP